MAEMLNDTQVEGRCESRAFDAVWGDMEGSDDVQNTTDVAISVMAQRFTDSTTMHGVRYMFMREAHYIRRIIWAWVVLGGLGYCMYIVYDSFTSYRAYPTTIRTKTIFESKSVFPAVTICPYNTFQKSGLSPEQLDAVQQVFGGYIFPQLANKVKLTDFDHTKVVDIYRNASYKFPTDYCRYKRRACTKEMLTETVTDFGFCKLFDVSKFPKMREQDTNGQNNGFDFADMVNESEWTLGPYFAYDGFRVAVHPPGTKVYYLRDKGFSLLPGYTTEVAINRQEIKLLPPPHGQCGSSKLAYFDQYSRDQCLVECETNHTVAVCGCRYFFMPGDAPVCTVSQTEECFITLTNTFGNLSKLFDQTKCHCPQDCESVEYQVDVIHTATTPGYAEFLLKYINFDLSDGMQLRVFYQDLQYREVEQVALFTKEKLICDIGGAAGLFLGCSFITVVELFDFLAELLWFCGIRQRRKIKQAAKECKEKKKRDDKQEDKNKAYFMERIKVWLNQAKQNNTPTNLWKT